MANKLDITDIEIKGLKEKDKVYTKHYGGGFYVYVRPNGRKICRYCYQANGKRRQYELGEYVTGKGKLAEIVKKYNQVHTNWTLNKVDPVDEIQHEAQKKMYKLDKKKKKEAKKQAKELKKQGTLTFSDVSGKFLEKYQGLKGNKKPSPRTMKDYKAHIDRITASFGQYPMSTLPEEKIMEYMDDIATTYPVMANRLFSTLSVVCTWAVKQKRYQIRKNPFAGMDKPSGKEKPKDRVLDFRPKHKKFKDRGEIKQFWQWLNTINSNHAVAFKLILLTGLRPGEALSLEWEDIDDDEIILPAEKTKNKKAIHAIPMVKGIRDLLDELKQKGSGYLFPARQLRTEKPSEIKSVKPATLSRLLAKSRRGSYTNGHGEDVPAGALHGIEKFSPHDLRRTCASHVGDLGYSMPEVGLLLNHAQGGVTAIYNHSDGTARKQSMLNAWHRRLNQLIEGKEVSNVVAIR